MTCRFCNWLMRRIGIDCAEVSAEKWEEIRTWERRYVEAEGWLAPESEANWQLIEEAGALRAGDPLAALALMRQAADAGSPGALETVGWHYWTGTLVPEDRDRAIDFYYRSAIAGSWIATLGYATLVREAGHSELADRTLTDGVEAGFAPAHYRLALNRLREDRSRQSCRELRPLLEFAAEQGHPTASGLLGGLMARAKFGVRNVLPGFRMILRAVNDTGKAGRPTGAGVLPGATPPAIPAA